MPKPTHLSIFFALLAAPCFAQRDIPDNTFSTTAGDSAMIDAIIRHSYELRASQASEAIEDCLKAIRLSKQLKYRKGEGRALGSLGWIYFSQNDFVNALETSYEGLKIAEAEDDKAEMARGYNNIGVLDNHQNQLDKAMTNFRKGLQLARQAGDPVIIARSLNNIGAMFHQIQPESDSAQIYCERALIISNAAGDDYYASVAKYNLGDIALQKKRYAEAMSRYSQALLSANHFSVPMKMDTRNKIASVLLLQNKTDKALSMLNETVRMATNGSCQQALASAYKMLFSIAKAQGDHKKALSYYERFISLQDSVYSAEVSERLAATRTQSDLDIKQTQIELLTKDTLINKDEINRQRTQLYTMVGGFIGILILAAVLTFSYQRIERTNVLLKQRTDELARINSTKDKLFSIISHDFRSPMNSLKGLLALVENKNLTKEEFSMLAEKLRKNFNAVSNDLENLLQWSMAQLQGIQTNFVRLNIRPIVDDHITVFQEIARAKSVKIENRFTEDLFGMADEDHIRLVLRNLISNAIKFTPHGGTVEISGYQENNFIKILVADTGVGIPSEQMENLFQKDRSVSTKGTNQEKGVGLGLQLCAEFVENNGGQLNVASQLGKGSVFSFTLRTA